MSSILECLYRQIVRKKDDPCLYYMEAQHYEYLSYEEVADRTQYLSQWMNEYCQPGDRVVIWSTNCWQWVVADLACQLSGLVSVPIYPTTGVDHLAFIFDDAMPVVVFLDDLTEERLELLQSVQSVQTIVPFFSVEKRPGEGSVVDFDDIMQGCSSHQIIEQVLWEKNRLADVFTILYTSGTTGIPKAVPLTHNNVLQNILEVLKIIQISETDSTLSFLPLSHILERAVGYYCILISGGYIYFARSMDTVAKDLLVARPTIIVSVPRLYEKIYQRVIISTTGLKAIVLRLAIGIGKIVSRRHILWKLAYNVVFKKIHQKTGGNVRFLVTGGAPISSHIEEFFNAIGLPVVQGYGLTETSPIITVNSVDSPKVGSVGLPLTNLDVRVAEDGELLVKGDSVFSGYSNVSNDGVFSDDGYFKTGDLARIDDDGYVYITGRKKELIVLSNGKNVSPSRVEGQIIQSDFINQVVVIGDDRSYLIALIVLNIDQVRSILDLNEDSLELCQNKDVMDLIHRDIGLLSTTLASFETVKRFRLIPHEFSVDGGELTPTLKLRRKEINKKYHDLVNSLYDINKL